MPPTERETLKNIEKPKNWRRKTENGWSFGETEN
jgi:hypothetical protein